MRGSSLSDMFPLPTGVVDTFFVCNNTFTIRRSHRGICLVYRMAAKVTLILPRPYCNNQDNCKKCERSKHPKTHFVLQIVS